MLGDKCGRNGGGGYLGGVECLISVSCVNGKREVAPGKINFRGRDAEFDRLETRHVVGPCD